jgi:hypothetical protein
MSMPPRQLPSIAEGDRLEMSAELQVTPDCRAHGPHCRADPYLYSPVVLSRLILTTGRRTTGGRDAVAISGRKRIRCPHNHANFVHHCRIVFQRSSLDIAHETLPCRPRDCRVNYVLSAHSRKATSGDKLLIGANGPTGQVVQDKGRLNAVRFHPGDQPTPPALTTNRRLRKHVSLRRRRTVILSKRLPALRRDEQLSVRSRLRVNVSHLPYDVHVSMRLLLTTERRLPRTSPRVEEEASEKGDITEQAGSNCTQRQAQCEYPGVGILAMRRDAVNVSGGTAPRYVNLVMSAEPKFVNPRTGDRVRVLRGSSLRVVRFPARLRG